MPVATDVTSMLITQKRSMGGFERNSSGRIRDRICAGWTLTIEQLCVMMFRYAQASGIVKENFASLRGYEFASDVHGWAKDAAAWAMELGFSAKTLLPLILRRFPTLPAFKQLTLSPALRRKAAEIDWDEALDYHRR